MTRTLLLGGILSLIPLNGLMAEEKTTATAPVDIEARKESITNLETRITQREQRLAEWGKDIVELDARIEKRVDELVKMIAGLRDSQDSRTKVTRIKKDAIDGLQKGIQMYVTKRKEIRESVRTGETEALGDLGKFDQRIIKRVDQIAELTKSIPTHDDMKKYESDGGSYWNGYYYENTRINDDWKQNRRDSGSSDLQRKETIKLLKEAQERLDQRRRSLKDLLANRELTEAARKLYQTELGQIDAYEANIDAQLRNVTTTSGSGGGQPVDLDQANDIEDLFNDSRKDLRDDVAQLFRLYDQFASGRSYIEGLKENLAARKKWLEENLAKP